MTPAQQLRVAEALRDMADAVDRGRARRPRQPQHTTIIVRGPHSSRSSAPGAGHDQVAREQLWWPAPATIEIRAVLRDEVSRALAEMGQSFRRLDRDINVAGAHGQLQRLEKVAYGVGREFGSLLRTMRITGSLIGGGDQPMRALLYLFLLVLPSLLFGAATVAAYRNRRSPSPPS